MMEYGIQLSGAVEKVRQRRSRSIVVLTYYRVRCARHNGRALRDAFICNLRPCPWKRRVLARWGWAGKKVAFLNSPFLLTHEGVGELSANLKKL